MFGKYILHRERGNLPAIAVSAVWLPVWHWRTESVSLGASKGIRLSDDVLVHVHAGAMRASWINGISTGYHPYSPQVIESGRVDAKYAYLYDPHRVVKKQALYGGIDVGLGKYVKLTAEGRGRLIADHPDALPGLVGIVFAPHRFIRVGFAYGTDGGGDGNHLKIGVGYNISTVD